MARTYKVYGETMVKVKGRSDSPIAALSELGLTSDPITITVEYKHLEIGVNAYGQVPPELQGMGMMARVNMTLVHFDQDVLDACLAEALAGSPGFGQLGHAGALMGNGLPRFAPGGANGNHFIGLNLISALGAPPWRFLYAQLAGQPMTYPIGAERSLVQLQWTAFPYSQDPWNNGNGSYGVTVFDRTPDA